MKQTNIYGTDQSRFKLIAKWLTAPLKVCGRGLRSVHCSDYNITLSVVTLLVGHQDQTLVRGATFTHIGLTAATGADAESQPGT